MRIWQLCHCWHSCCSPSRDLHHRDFTKCRFQFLSTSFRGGWMPWQKKWANLGHQALFALGRSGWVGWLRDILAVRVKSLLIYTWPSSEITQCVWGETGTGQTRPVNSLQEYLERHNRIALIFTSELSGSTTWTKHNLWFNTSNLYTYNIAIFKKVAKHQPINAWNNKNLQAEDIQAMEQNNIYHSTLHLTDLSNI